MADNSTILEKLDGLVARFEEISTLITDPAVIADQKRYVKLTKEYKTGRKCTRYSIWDTVLKFTCHRNMQKK